MAGCWENVRIAYTLILKTLRENEFIPFKTDQFMMVFTTQDRSFVIDVGESEDGEINEYNGELFCNSSMCICLTILDVLFHYLFLYHCLPIFYGKTKCSISLIM